MASVEAARPFLRRDGPRVGGQHGCEASPLTTKRFPGPPCRQKVLVVGDIRPRIYPRYRSSPRPTSATEGRRRRVGGGAYRGLPSADTAGTGSVVTAGPVDRPEFTSESLGSSESETGNEMCPTYGIKPGQTEWKLVE